MVNKKITSLSLALLLSTVAYNARAEEEVICDEVAEEVLEAEQTKSEDVSVDAVEEAEQTRSEVVDAVEAQPEAKPQIALKYENIDELCESQGLIVACAWTKKADTDAATWAGHLETMFETAQAEPSPHFADLLGLIANSDSSMDHAGQLVLSQNKLVQDEQIKRTKKEDIDFVGVAEANDQVQFTIRINADEYTAEDWKRILTRVIDFSDRKQANPEDESLTISTLIECLGEVERLPMEEVVETTVEVEDNVAEVSKEEVVVEEELLEAAV